MFQDLGATPLSWRSIAPVLTRHRARDALHFTANLFQLRRHNTIPQKRDVKLRVSLYAALV
jgi:hypothetical protein